MQSCRNGTEIRVESHLVFQWTFTVLDGPPSWLPLVTFMLDPLCSFRYVILEVYLLIVTNNDDTCTVHILILSYIKQDQIITEKIQNSFPAQVRGGGWGGDCKYYKNFEFSHSGFPHFFLIHKIKRDLKKYILDCCYPYPIPYTCTTFFKRLH